MLHKFEHACTLNILSPAPFVYLQYANILLTGYGLGLGCPSCTGKPGDNTIPAQSYPLLIHLETIPLSQPFVPLVVANKIMRQIALARQTPGVVITASPGAAYNIVPCN